jgi:uncharacterized protein involved in outer membrane biogenesis
MHPFAALLTVSVAPRFASRAAAMVIGVAGLAGAGQALAQTPAKPAAAPAAPVERVADTPSRANQLIENIQVDSPSVRIDEQRFGGETRSISVAPKGGFPAYEVQPQSGVRSWKILGF